MQTFFFFRFKILAYISSLFSKTLDSKSYSVNTLPNYLPERSLAESLLKSGRKSYHVNTPLHCYVFIQRKFKW